ncbi:MAG: hypothetical protein ACI4Q3_00485 [Kiritimatiellia bacterium]
MNNMSRNRYEPVKNPPLHHGVAIFHHVESYKPIALNPVIIYKIGISNHERGDTMVFYGQNEYIYVAESIKEATVIWANALNGTTDWEGVDTL